MRTFDLTPLYRSTVGFDRMFSMLDELDGWRARCRAIRLTISSGPVRTPIASRSQSPASPTLISRSRRRRIGWRSAARSRPTREKTGDVLYQGIAARTFERSFQLADYVEVKGASLENGLLHVDLVREIPEAMKPRAIPIASSSKLLEVKPTKLAA